MAVEVGQRHRCLIGFLTVPGTRATTPVRVPGSSGRSVSPLRNQKIQRVSTATTTTIPRGVRSFSVTVVTAASAASPTLDGVALPAGFTGSFDADGYDGLHEMDLVTVSGDDVIILTVN